MSCLLLVGDVQEIIELAERCHRYIVGIIDSQLEGEYMGHAILGCDDQADRIFRRFSDEPVVFVPDRSQTCVRLADCYLALGFTSETLADPGASLSRTANLGLGVLSHNGANVSSHADLGDLVRVNAYANVMHAVEVGKGTTIAPNAVQLGGKVAPGRSIGAAAVLLPGVSVGEGTVVGAGAIVTKDAAAHNTVVGNPAWVLQ